MSRFGHVARLPSPLRSLPTAASRADRRWKLRLAMLLMLGLSIASAARAEPNFRDDFEGPATAWTNPVGNVHFEVRRHARVQDGAHWGQAAELISLMAGNGTYLHWSYDVGRARVIDELQPSVWIKSDRPGIQLFARIVLPRTIDPRTGQAATVIVPGHAYSQVGTWQQLRCEPIPQLVERQARMLRVELQTEVDTREAYLDRLLLNVYGGLGETNVWIDDLEIEGYVRPSVVQAGYRAVAAAAPASEATPRPSVRLSGSILLVDEQPMFPRIVPYQGESLAFLARLGFNTVQLNGLPTPELLQEATQTGMWLICPPPIGPTGNIDELGTAKTLIGPAYDRVLMWHLGDRLTSLELERTQQWAESIRLADRDYARPLVCGAETDLRAYSRCVDVLIISRAPLATSLELPDYGVWLRERPRLARPGTPIWTTVQTEPSPELAEQTQWLTAGSILPRPTAAQIRLLTYTALSAGARGLIFQSTQRLDGGERSERARASFLELLNLELQLLEPWTASGHRASLIAGSEPEVQGVVLQTKRARLLLPMWVGRGSQVVPGQSAGSGVSFIVPGVPESHRAFELTPAGLTLLRDKKRVAGGIRVTLDEFGLTGMVLLTEDAQIQGHIQRQLQMMAPRAAELRHELAESEALATNDISYRLSSQGQSQHDADDLLGVAGRHLQTANQSLVAGNPAAAYLEVSRAERALRMVQHKYWTTALEPFGSPVTSPLTLGFATIPRHWNLVANLNAASFGDNRLRGGEFERLDTLRVSGWSNFQHVQRGVEAAAELSPQTAHGGQFCLRLAVTPVDQQSPGLLETAPIWVVTPPIEFEPGQLVRIHGRVRVPKAITSSVDGLLIIDSWGGESMAERIGATKGWQEFTLLRVAPQNKPLTVTFALTGLGEALLDDIAVEPLLRPGQTTPSQASRLPALPRTPR